MNLPDEHSAYLARRDVGTVVAVVAAFLLGLLARWAFGCSATPPPEPDHVEVASTRARDAGHDAAQPPDAAFDATLPWWGPDPAGNPPPHRAR